MTHSTVDHREFLRYRCGGPGLLTAYVGDDGLAAELRDLSRGGIGVILPRRAAIGERLLVTLATPSLAHTREVRVTHVSPVAGDTWYVGGTFTHSFDTMELLSVLLQARAALTPVGQA